MQLTRTLTSLFAAAGLALAVAPAAHALDIKLGHVLAPSHSWNKAAEGFAAEVKEKTAGRVNFILFPSGQLGNEKTMLEGLQIGSQGAAIIGSGSLQPIEPKFGIVELPYTWTTSQQAYKAYDGELGAALAKLAEKKNLVIVSWWENGFRHLTNNRGPVNTPADLNGLKTRVTPDKMRLDTSPWAPTPRRWPSASSTRPCSRRCSTRRKTRCRSSTPRRSSRSRSICR
ncbi:Extracytoplasmic solute receptor protein yiaO [Bordetella parapertussis]|nr:Extracytoplasmic solute receptor protein yiaO [Bordetella parapertussis]SUV58576.1 Extracytoplasmic solute receptor protein yiaO [Bordetella parapertussis]SUV79076.1 TRAP-type C4-dicarboxylate transport system, periplasmic component [Bordetella parapertussis]VEF52670.1 Extracytoplasmic solute receptor protein yiaO [Bordetella parapertussis]VTR30806.1 Extracytoplasmic solute receptor protein yiaO [Bordetella parapertussis]